MRRSRSDRRAACLHRQRRASWRSRRSRARASSRQGTLSCEESQVTLGRVDGAWRLALCPASCRFPLVLVDQAAETIATTHAAVAAGLARRRLRYRQLEAAVGPARVVVRHELPQDSLQVGLAENQEVVQA